MYVCVLLESHKLQKWDYDLRRQASQGKSYTAYMHVQLYVLFFLVEGGSLTYNEKHGFIIHLTLAYTDKQDHKRI